MNRAIDKDREPRDNQGRRHGKYIYHFINGNERAIKWYKHDKPHGLQQGFYKTGHYWINRYNKNGQAFGSDIRYD